MFFRSIGSENDSQNNLEQDQLVAFETAGPNDENWEDNIHVYRKLLAQNNPYALYKMERCFTNIATGIASANDYIIAAWCCGNGVGGKQINFPRAIEYYMAASQLGLGKTKAEAEIELALHNFQNNPDESFRLLGNVANSGVGVLAQFAQNTLTLLSGESYSSKQAAFSSLLLIAEAGYVHAMMTVSSCYQKGVDVPKNAEASVKWLHLAEEQHHLIALYRLGYCYENGFGVLKDTQRASNYYSRANAEVECARMLRRLDEELLSESVSCTPSPVSQSFSPSPQRSSLSPFASEFVPAAKDASEEIAVNIWEINKGCDNSRLSQSSFVLMPTVRNGPVVVHQSNEQNGSLYFIGEKLRFVR